MKRKVIAVIGEPGVGKTSLFFEFIKNHTWETREPEKMIHTLYCEYLDLYIIGKYEEGKTFSGTDALGMSIQPNATKFVKETTSNILFEGDRLTNAKFFDELLKLPDTDVEIINLTAPSELLNERYKERGSNQSDTFLKSRKTKIANIRSNFDYMDYMKVFKNINKDDQKDILSYLSEKFLFTF